jgi:hypothetical protein
MWQENRGTQWEPGSVVLIKKSNHYAGLKAIHLNEININNKNYNNNKNNN